MLISENITTSTGKQLLKTYSDSNKYIIQTDTGRKYVLAVDIVGTTHTYEESNEDLPKLKERTKEG